MHAGRQGANERLRAARARPLLVGAVILLIATTAHAERPTLMMRPEAGLQEGTETFELSLSVPAPSTLGGTVTGSSRLSYPIGAPLGGGTLRFDIGRFSIASTAWTNLADPWGTMVDQDWLSLGSQRVEFSHTDSRTTLRALVVEGAVRLRLAALSEEPGATSVYAVAGFRYESSAYEAYGASGWQLDPNSNRVQVSLPGDPLALRYDVRYRLPFVGVGLEFGRGRRFVLNTEARFFPSWSSHDDDHVLRNKAAHSSASGFGFGLAAEPGIDLGVGSGAQVIVGVSGQLHFISSHGQLQQHFYGDDPFSPGNEVGESIPDADFTATSVRARLLAFLSVRL